MAPTNWSRNWATTTGDNNNEQENVGDAVRRICVENECTCFLRADQRPGQNHEDVLLPAHLQGTVTICESSWTVVELGSYSHIAYFVSQRSTTLLRHGHLSREEDGVIEFLRIKEYLRNDLERSQHWSDEKWKSTMAKGGGNITRFQYCTESIRTRNSWSRSSWRSFRTQSHWSSITGECRDSGRFLQVHFSRRMCNQFRSIINSGLISGGQNLSNGQTVFFTIVDPMKKEHKDPDVIRLNAPGVVGRNQTCSQERIEILSNAVERNYPLRHTPSLLFPEGYHDEIWRSYLRESIRVTSNSSKFV